jgi:glycosyltransferase involved in cell wall biosynthesis
VTHSSQSVPSICFVAHNAFGALTGKTSVHAGGIERQQALMARWLVRHGHRVSMITWNEGSDTAGEHDGIAVFPMCRREEGLPGLRFFHPRWTSLHRALSSADADLYYYNCGDLGLGQIAFWARAHRRRLVFSVPSDPDCMPSLPALHNRRERVLYRHGLRNCDAIIVQTHKQQRLLEEGFGLASTVLPMPCEGLHDQPLARSSSAVRVLWVGRISPEKRPDWFLDIAERLPQWEFDLVGAPNEDSAYARNVIERAARLPNVTLSGRVAYDQMPERYRRASILCSTSVYEGFPNVFLEAWSGGIPVVATCDPDGLIASRDLGRTGQSVEELTAGVAELGGNARLREDVGSRARCYFHEHHMVDRAMAEFAKLFARVAGD